MKECLVFDVFGPLACFKAYFTTSSPLTFDFPPKTALAGLIGAIVGLDYEKKYDLFAGLVSLKILSNGAKLYSGINWIDTKARDAIKFSTVPSHAEVLKSIGLPATAEIGAFIGMTWPGKHPHTQVNLELLKEPRYRVYYPDTSPRYAELKDRIAQHQAVYTPFLGAAQFIANFDLVEVASVTKEDTEGSAFIPIDSIIPVPSGKPGPELEMGTTSPLMIRVPRTMIPGRQVTDYSTVIYTLNGERLAARVSEYYHVKGTTVDDNVIFY